jgi:hypothetical protein
MHFESQGYAYDFDLDGKEYPMPDGGTIAYRAANPTTWESTYRLEGTVLVTLRRRSTGIR